MTRPASLVAAVRGALHRLSRTAGGTPRMWWRTVSPGRAVLPVLPGAHLRYAPGVPRPSGGAILERPVAVCTAPILTGRGSEAPRARMAERALRPGRVARVI